jgi:hypothetical protein
MRRHRRAVTGLLRALLVALAVSAIVTGKAWLERSRTAVAGRATVARFAPSPQSVASFDVSQGAHVHVVESAGGWTKIEFQGNRGWIPSDSLERQRPLIRVHTR